MNDHTGASVQALGQAYFLDLLGDAYTGLGRYSEAIVALTEAAAAFRQHDARAAYAACLLKMGQSHQALAHSEAAVGCLKESLVIFRELELPGQAEQARHALDGCRTLTAHGAA